MCPCGLPSQNEKKYRLPWLMYSNRLVSYTVIYIMHLWNQTVADRPGDRELRSVWLSMVFTTNHDKSSHWLRECRRIWLITNLQYMWMMGFSVLNECVKIQFSSTLKCENESFATVREVWYDGRCWKDYIELFLIILNIFEMFSWHVDHL